VETKQHFRKTQIFLSCRSRIVSSGGQGFEPLHQILIQIPYNPDVELDSVTFRFSSDPNMIFAFYSKASSYIWTEVSPHQEDLAYIYRVNDLGMYGKYALNFEFTADIYENANHLAFEANLSMHQTTILQLTSLTAHVFLDATIPSDIGQTTT